MEVSWSWGLLAPTLPGLQPQQACSPCSPR